MWHCLQGLSCYCPGFSPQICVCVVWDPLWTPTVNWKKYPSWLLRSTTLIEQLYSASVTWMSSYMLTFHITCHSTLCQTLLDAFLKSSGGRDSAGVPVLLLGCHYWRSPVCSKSSLYLFLSGGVNAILDYICLWLIRLNPFFFFTLMRVISLLSRFSFIK